jgi:chromosomal replication initiator protein
MPSRSALTRLLPIPETRSARAAIEDLHGALTGAAVSAPNPLFLHGPTGAGKTLLVDALAVELAKGGRTVCQLSANDFADRRDLHDAEDADLLIVEDLQHLPMRYVDTLIALIDARLRHGAAMVFTALSGPNRLKHRGTTFPTRLTSRLAAGLVIALEPLQTPSRRLVLKRLAEQAELKPAAEVLDWLAEHLTGGGRQLDGAIRQLKALQRLQAKPLRLADIRAHFDTQIDAQAPSVKRITEQVSGYFEVAPRRLLSTRRTRDVLVPRQISMYLARQLTSLSLQEIGAYFGGRDHKTVQHACKKVEAAMKADTVLCGAVRQIHAELA